MATNATPAPAETVKASKVLTSCISAIIAKEAEITLLYDRYKVSAKAEATRLGLTDRKGLTAVLYASGDKDARRISEVVGFVFPANAENRKVIDAAMDANAAEKNPNKRIKRDVILAMQRAKEPITLKEAEKLVAEKSTATRAPGGETSQVEKTTAKPKKLTPAQVEEALGALFDAALLYGKEHGYDAADCAAVMEARSAEIFESSEEEEESESE